MNLSDFKKFYVLDEGHFYVSKVKQYNADTFMEFALILNFFEKLFSFTPDKELVKRYNSFKPKSLLVNYHKQVLIDDSSKLFISIYLLTEGVFDSNHLKSVNPTKFKKFENIQKDFLSGENYDFFINKYGKDFLNRELSIYFRNSSSWLSKYGFWGIYENKTAYITEVGYEFASNYHEREIISAIFTYQIKIYQHWNPAIDSKYSNYSVRPYFLLLEVINLCKDNYFTKDEYVLFISKIKSHNALEIRGMIELLHEFRELSGEDKKKYIHEIIELDKKKYKNRKRTMFETIKDSSAKELDVFTFGNVIIKGNNEYSNCFILNDRGKFEKLIFEFNQNVKFIEFTELFDWINHLGSRGGLSLENLIEMYIRDGKSTSDIKNSLNIGGGNNSKIDDVIVDKLYEKHIEDYYITNIKEIDPNLEVINEPNYGRQYPTHIGPIDILCKNLITDEFVVLELKRGHTNDEVVGQILRYMGWVYLNLEKSDKLVRGIIIGKEFSENIDYSIFGMQSNKSLDLIKLFKHPFDDINRPVLN